MKQTFTAALVICLLVNTGFSNQKEFNIRDYGALADGTTVNTSAIQNAIDACSAAGGGKVIIDGGDYVSGTILLKDNVTLHIEDDVTLLGSKNPLDYKSIDAFTDATGQVRGKCLVGALEVSNVRISGSGTIDGRGESFLRENLNKTLEELNVAPSKFKELAGNRPFLVRFVKSSNIIVKDIHLRQPAAWTCHFFQCSSILVDGINIYSHAHKNNDGIDLDSSNNAVIRNCTIDSGDDAICFKTTSPIPTYNVQVRDCNLKSHWGTIKFGTESMGDFRNILLEDCQIHETRGGGIKVLSVDGANINNLIIRNIEMDQVDMPIFFRLGERRRTYRDAPQQEVGSINNVRISHVTAKTWNLEESRISPPSGILITGTPNHRIGSIYLENISITLPGGGTEEQKELVIAEDELRYPEFSFFGVLPASAIFARHVENLNIKNLSLTLQASDQRHPSRFIDVNQLTTDNITLNGEAIKPMN